MRPGPGPTQVVEVAQRQPSEDQELQRRGHHLAEGKSKSAQTPSRT
jgi:hypothetical protein